MKISQNYILKRVKITDEAKAKTEEEAKEDDEMGWNQLLCEERIRPYKKGGLPGNDLRTEFEKDYHRIIGSGELIREIHVEPQRS